VAVLVGAVACLGLTMCARTQKPPPQQSRPQQAQPQPQPNPPPQAPALEEGDMAKRKPTYFPATKAPGGMYQQR